MVARRLLVIVLTTLVTLGCLLLGGMPHARAADSSPVLVEVKSMTPTIAKEGTPVTVTGAVTNRSDSTLSAVNVRVGVSPQLLDTTAQVQSWQAGKLDTSTHKVGGQTIGDIEPGATAQFSVTIAKGTLHYAYDLASLPMTVQVSGTGFHAQPVRTTLEWSKKAPAQPLDATFIVPLTLPADPALYGPSGSERTAAWNRAIGPGSRIEQLVTDLGDLPVTWVVDPSIVEPPVGADHNLPKAQAPASSGAPSSTSPDTSTAPGDTPESTPKHTVPPDAGDSEGHLLPGSSPTTSLAAGTDPVDALAQTMLTRLQTVAAAGTVWWTPYDDPDVSALAGAGREGRTLLTRDLERRLPAELRKISDVTVAWPATATGSTRTTQISSIWKRATGRAPTLLVPARSVSPLTGATPDATRRVQGSSGAVVYDESLSSILSAAATSPLQAAQHFMAQTAAVYQQSPGTPRSLAVVLPREDDTPPEQLADAVTRILDTPWLQSTGGDQVTSGLPPFVDAKIRRKPEPGPSSPAAARSPINTLTFSSVNRDRRVMRGLGSVLVDSRDVVQERMRSFDIAGSSRWRGQASAFATVVRADSDAVESMRRKISVLPSTVNFFANSGQLTVTVNNGLNRPLKDVELSLHPRRFLLRIREPDQQMQIRASSRSTVRFEVKAVAAGKVPIDAVLRTPDGLPLGAISGDATQLQVNVRPTSSWIYWVLGIVAGLVLVIGLVRTLRRGPRTVTAPGPTGAPVPDPAADDERIQQDTPKAAEDD